MKKKILMSVSAVIIILALILGGVMYYVSKLVTPEQVRAMAVDGISRALPGATPEIGKINLSFGLNVKLNIDDFSLKLKKKKGKNLFGVSKVDVSIPIWSILTGGGTANVQLISPTLDYYEYSTKSNNWDLALKSSTKDRKKIKTKKVTTSSKKTVTPVDKKKSSDLVIPAFLTRIKANITLSDTIVSYRLKDKTSGKIKIDKFALKKLNLLSPTAFEFRSNMKFALDPKTKQEVKLHTLAIGEFDLSEYINKQTVSSSVMVKLQNVDLGIPSIKIPDLKTNIKVALKKDGSINGDIKSVFLNRNTVSAKFNVSSKQIAVDGVGVSLFVHDLIKISGQHQPMIAPDKSKLQLNGSVKIKKGLVFPQLNFELSPTLAIKLDGINGTLGASGSYDGKKVALNSVIEALGGSISARVKGEYSINNPPKSLDKMKPFLTVLKATNLQIEESEIRKLLYSKKSVTAQSSTPKTKNSKGVSDSSKQVVHKKKTPAILLPPGKIKVEVAHAKVGKSNFDAKSLILIQPSSISTKFFDINFSKGKGKLTHRTDFKKGSIKNKFSFNMRSLDLKGIKPFLPPFLESVSGTFNGKVNGTLSLSDEKMTYRVSTNLNAKDGQLSGLKIGDFIEDIASLSFLKGKTSKLKLDNAGDFESFYLSAKFTDKLYTIKKANFVAIKKQFKFKAKGKVYPPPYRKESKLYCDYQDSNYISKVLQKQTNTKVLPVLLKGPGFDLAVDKLYTTKALAKAYTKKNAKKLKQKGKKQLKKLFKKFF